MRVSVIVPVLLAVLPAVARAQTSFTDGNFTSVTPLTYNGTTYNYFQLSPNSLDGTHNGTAYDTSQSVAGWTSSGYNFVISSAAGAADQGAFDIEYQPSIAWFDKNNIQTGDVNTWNGGGPTGYTGNILAADSAYQTAPISQTITGLVVGKSYLVTFDWAGAQQTAHTGATYEGWSVCLGTQCDGTAILNNVNHGFTGWQNGSFAFQATSTSEVLSFLALGGPGGVPPFALLADVNFGLDLPEPGSIAVMGAGALMLAFSRRRGKTVLS